GGPGRGGPRRTAGAAVGPPPERLELCGAGEAQGEARLRLARPRRDRIACAEGAQRRAGHARPVADDLDLQDEGGLARSVVVARERLLQVPLGSLDPPGDARLRAGLESHLPDRVVAEARREELLPRADPG